MTEEFATKTELTVLAEEVAKKEINAYDAKKAAEENSFVKWFVPTELNGIKSEITALKAEFVPFNASLPSLWSFEELLKKQLNLEHGRSGFLQRAPEAASAADNTQSPPGSGAANTATTNAAQALTTAATRADGAVRQANAGLGQLNQTANRVASTLGE